MKKFLSSLAALALVLSASFTFAQEAVSEAAPAPEAAVAVEAAPAAEATAEVAPCEPVAPCAPAC